MKRAQTFRPPAQKNCRELAAEILTRVDVDRAYADILLDQTLKYALLAGPDRALLTEIVYGTLRWRGWIDWILSHVLRRPLANLNPFLRNVLRSGLYQMLYLTRVPEYAAVNEAVELAKRFGGQETAGMVNAVLRRAAREKATFHLPDAAVNPAAYLAVRWSHPEGLARKWLDDFSFSDTEALLQANNEEAPLVVRVNRLRTGAEALVEQFRARGFEGTVGRWSPQAIRLNPGTRVTELPGFNEGLFQVQGEASQIVAYLLGPTPGERVLDACAAPGGKTTHLAELMEDKGEVIAADLSQRGLEKVKENMHRLGITSVRCFAADVTQRLEGPLSRPYDRILVDAPCSGLGTLRSHPEARWHRGPEDIERLARLQRKILHNVLRYLKQGGVLVYATCTLTREENEALIADVLRTERGLMPEDAAKYLP
ncbi:MAG: 16S rRNA (cytosine(967)-C(5))-methyltransferase RsmB, partial [Candidatus Binatia bacterium]